MHSGQAGPYDRQPSLPGNTASTTINQQQRQQQQRRASGPASGVPSPTTTSDSSGNGSATGGATLRRPSAIAAGEGGGGSKSPKATAPAVSGSSSSVASTSALPTGAVRRTSVNGQLQPQPPPITSSSTKQRSLPLQPQEQQQPRRSSLSPQHQSSTSPTASASSSAPPLPSKRSSSSTNAAGAAAPLFAGGGGGEGGGTAFNNSRTERGSRLPAPSTAASLSSAGGMHIAVAALANKLDGGSVNTTGVDGGGVSGGGGGSISPASSTRRRLLEGAAKQVRRDLAVLHANRALSTDAAAMATGGSGSVIVGGATANSIPGGGGGGVGRGGGKAVSSSMYPPQPHTDVPQQQQQQQPQRQQYRRGSGGAEKGVVQPIISRGPPLRLSPTGNGSVKGMHHRRRVGGADAVGGGAGAPLASEDSGSGHFDFTDSLPTALPLQNELRHKEQQPAILNQQQTRGDGDASGFNGGSIRARGVQPDSVETRLLSSTTVAGGVTVGSLGRSSFSSTTTAATLAAVTMPAAALYRKQHQAQPPPSLSGPQPLLQIPFQLSQTAVSTRNSGVSIPPEAHIGGAGVSSLQATSKNGALGTKPSTAGNNVLFRDSTGGVTGGSSSFALLGTATISGATSNGTGTLLFSRSSRNDVIQGGGSGGSGGGVETTVEFTVQGQHRHLPSPAPQSSTSSLSFTHMERRLANHAVTLPSPQLPQLLQTQLLPSVQSRNSSLAPGPSDSLLPIGKSGSSSSIIFGSTGGTVSSSGVTPGVIALQVTRVPRQQLQPPFSHTHAAGVSMMARSLPAGTSLPTQPPSTQPTRSMGTLLPSPGYMGGGGSRHALALAVGGNALSSSPGGGYHSGSSSGLTVEGALAVGGAGGVAGGGGRDRGSTHSLSSTSSSHHSSSPPPPHQHRSQYQQYNQQQPQASLYKLSGAGAAGATDDAYVASGIPSVTATSRLLHAAHPARKTFSSTVAGTATAGGATAAGGGTGGARAHHQLLPGIGTAGGGGGSVAASRPAFY